MESLPSWVRLQHRCPDYEGANDFIWCKGMAIYSIAQLFNDF